jgi:multiple antibiotic resistance protein
MQTFFRDFFEAFIPLFVAIDPFGMVPIFLAVTANMTAVQRRRVSFEAVGAATIIALSFMLLGHAIFRFLYITEDDFRIAGGILLLVLAIMDLLIPGKPAVDEPQIVGIVPLAMPLIAGPATLTTVLVLASNQDRTPAYNYSITALSLVVNFALLLVVMLAASRIGQIIGLNALRALSKLVMVLLAAIAVNFIRTGITNLIVQAQ